MKFTRLLYCSIIMAFLAVSCHWQHTLQDLTYYGDTSACRVYIEESNALVPYLVLSKEYNGNCLLVREFLLDKMQRYNNIGNPNYLGYYEDSEIDVYLNNDFYETLSQNIQDMVIDSSIEITAMNSLGVGGKDIITINRKVFLLSYAEVNGTTMLSIFLREGRPLAFFSRKSNRIACLPSGNADNWWLRTANTASTSLVCAVESDGVIGSGGVRAMGKDNYIGVRPAFCLERGIPIQLEELNGNKIYVIK